jgi:hypothetical protein
MIVCVRVCGARTRVYVCVFGCLYAYVHMRIVFRSLFRLNKQAMANLSLSKHTKTSKHIIGASRGLNTYMHAHLHVLNIKIEASIQGIQSGILRGTHARVLGRV